jgi:hypothetical protein
VAAPQKPPFEQALEIGIDGQWHHTKQAPEIDHDGFLWLAWAFSGWHFGGRPLPDVVAHE